MRHDFNKPSYVTSNEEITHKNRLPIYMLILVGLFLVSLLIYMAAIGSNLKLINNLNYTLSRNPSQQARVF